LPDPIPEGAPAGSRAPSTAAVRIIYTNYRRETALRTVIPDSFWFGETEWHRGEQWFMDAYDVERHAIRSFALADIKSWSSSDKTNGSSGGDAFGIAA
jgi:predicted DNA-binding transcriptional regulator YafY